MRKVHQISTSFLTISAAPAASDYHRPQPAAAFLTSAIHHGAATDCSIFIFPTADPRPYTGIFSITSFRPPTIPKSHEIHILIYSLN